jgi:hypothetical protein
MAPTPIAWRLAAVTDVLVQTPHAKTLLLDAPVLNRKWRAGENSTQGGAG